METEQGQSAEPFVWLRRRKRFPAAKRVTPLTLTLRVSAELPCPLGRAPAFPAAAVGGWHSQLAPTCSQRWPQPGQPCVAHRPQPAIGPRGCSNLRSHRSPLQLKGKGSTSKQGPTVKGAQLQGPLPSYKYAGNFSAGNSSGCRETVTPRFPAMPCQHHVSKLIC